MQHALQHLVKTCKPGKPCPIIDMALDDAPNALSKQSPPTSLPPRLVALISPQTPKAITSKPLNEPHIGRLHYAA